MLITPRFKDQKRYKEKTKVDGFFILGKKLSLANKAVSKWSH